MKRNALIALVALGATACATTAPVVATPDDIPALEAQVAEAPADASALTLLGVAYHAADRHADAVTALRRAAALPDAPEVATLYLGLALESVGEWRDARDAYTTYLAAGVADEDLRADVQRRVALADRELLEVEARRLLEQEDQLAALPAQPRSVAVFPFRVTSDDARFAPLQAALTDMVTTDMGIPGVLVMIERAQIGAVVREMALTLAGATDESGARVGRLMRAQHVVQGGVTVVDEQSVRLDMAVVDAATRTRVGGTESEAALEQIFDAEKALVFAALDALGVTLTAAEREAIEENRAANLIAFLAYGEGLAAVEAGDFAAAAAAFGRAVQADPGFAPAAAAQAEAIELQQAAETSPDQIALEAVPQLPSDALVDDARNTALNDVVDRTNPNPGSQYTGEGNGPQIAAGGLEENDTSDDHDEAVIGNQGSAGIDIGIPNPTVP